MLQMMREHYEKGMSLSAIGEKWGAPYTTVQKILDRKRVQERYTEELARRERKAEIKRRIAALRATDASPEMMEQIIAIASQSVADTDIKFQYAIHNAAADVLNRAGVQAKQDDTKEVRVVLESGIELGEPE